MPKVKDVSLQTLNDRLGRPFVKRQSGGSGRAVHTMMWACNGPEAPVCSARAEAKYRPTPPDLSPWDQELFDNTPCPEDGWTLTPCPQHRDTFADHPEQPD